MGACLQLEEMPTPMHLGRFRTLAKIHLVSSGMSFSWSTTEQFIIYTKLALADYFHVDDSKIITAIWL